MGLFKSKAEKQLDSIILRLQMNMSNNSYWTIRKRLTTARLKSLVAGMINSRMGCLDLRK